MFQPCGSGQMVRSQLPDAGHISPDGPFQHATRTIQEAHAETLMWVAARAGRPDRGTGVLRVSGLGEQARVFVGGVIALLDLLIMLVLCSGLRPEHLSETGRAR